MATRRTLFKFWCWLTLFISSVASADTIPSPVLYMFTNGYAIVTSQDLDVTLQPSSESQILLTEHVLLETNILKEHISVAYFYNGQSYRRNILLQKQGNQPFIDILLTKREPIEHGERVTLELNTNVPLRVVTELLVTINGQPISISDDLTFSYDAFHRKSIVEVSMSLLNIKQAVTTQKTLEHSYEVDMGCNVRERGGRLYALCFTNTSGEQRVEFTLDGKSLSTSGDIAYFPDSLDAVVLHYFVGSRHNRYSITQINGEFITNLIK